MEIVKSKFLYLDAKDKIVKLISKMKPGDRIPARSYLMKEIGVTRTTIDRAISELIGEHFLYSLDGSGTYVRGQVDIPEKQQAVCSWAVLVRDIVSDTYPEILRGIEDFANQKNINIIICNTDSSVKKQQDYIKKLIASNVSGLIIIPPVAINIELDSYHALKENRIPFIFCNRYVEGVEAPRVISNNYYGAFIGARHLISLGHKKIAFLAPPNYSLVEQRLQGYMSAMADASIPINQTYIIYEEKAEYLHMGYNGMEKLLSLAERPTAVLCFNDAIAFGAFRAAHDRGLTIPEDIALVGYDDSPICNFFRIGLTTVKYPTYETGRCASELLWSISIDDSSVNQNQTIILNPKLIVRETCGAKMKASHE
jgi:DNA-binding LacI/PurR family transcriptional regulator